MNYSDGARQKLSDGIWLHFTFTKQFVVQNIYQYVLSRKRDLHNKVKVIGLLKIYRTEATQLSRTTSKNVIRTFYNKIQFSHVSCQKEKTEKSVEYSGIKMDEKKQGNSLDWALFESKHFCISDAITEFLPSDCIKLCSSAGDLHLPTHDTFWSCHTVQDWHISERLQRVFRAVSCNNLS